MKNETGNTKTQIEDLEPAPFTELSEEQMHQVSGGKATGSGSIAWSDQDPDGGGGGGHKQE